MTEKRNHILLHQAGYVVWLKASPETIFDRVSRNKNRPLLQVDDPLQTIKEMLEGRMELYDAIDDLSINTDKLTLEEIAFGIVESVRVSLKLT